MLIMPTKGKDFIAELEASGWQLDRIRGSHNILKKGDKTVTVPSHNFEMSKGTEAALRKATGVRKK